MLFSFAEVGSEKVVVYWPYGTTIVDVPKSGQYVRIDGVTQVMNEGPYTQYLVSQGMTSKIGIVSMGRPFWNVDPISTVLKYRAFLIEGLNGTHDDTESSLAAAILFGYQSTLTSQPNAFRAAGLSHMLSVSGSHFALALVALELILKSLKLTRKVHLMCCIAFSLGFVCMTGMAPSALRAGIMLCIAQLSWFSRRRTSLLATLSVGGIIMLAFSPYLALSVGFQLSFAAVLGIAIFSKMFRRLFGALPWRLPDYFVDNIALSLSAVLGTLPLIVAIFSQASPLSFISSLFTTYIFSLLMFLGFVFAFVYPFVPFLGDSLLLLIHAVTGMLLKCVMYLGDIPGMMIKFGNQAEYCASVILLLEIGLYFWYPMPGISKRLTELRLLRKKDIYTRRLVIAAVVSCAGIAFLMSPYGYSLRTNQRETDGCYFFNVGQGDATLIKQNGTIFLIDAGPDSVALQNALRKAGVTRIDSIIFTHAHADHVDGAKGLSRAFKIKRIIVAQGCENDPAIREVSMGVGAPVQTVLADDVLSSGPLSLDVVWPNEAVTDSENNNSCLMVDVRNAPKADGNRGGTDDRHGGILITGDGEKDAVRAACEQNNINSLDVLKLGHHGSKNSLDESLLKQVKVRRIVISVGENTYGHPKDEVLKLIKRFHIPYQRTDQSGTIFVPSMAQ